MLLIPVLASAGNLVTVTPRTGSTPEAMKNELISLGCTPVNDTNILNGTRWRVDISCPSWTFIPSWGGPALHIDDVLFDPGLTTAEVTELETKVATFINASTNVTFEGVSGRIVQNAYYVPAPPYMQENGSNGIVPPNSGSANDAVQLNVELTDATEAYSYPHAFALDGHIDLGGYGNIGVNNLEYVMNLAGNPNYADHPSYVADVINQYVGSHFYPDIVFTPVDMSNAVDRAIGHNADTLYNPTNPVSGNTDSMKEMERAYDHGILPVHSYGNSTLPVIGNIFNTHYDSDKILTVAGYKLLPPDANGVQLPDYSSVPCEPSGKTDVVSRGDPNNDGIQNSSSFASASVVGMEGRQYVQSIFNGRKLTVEERMIAVINSTKLYNNRSVKNVCSGWGAVNEAAIRDYIASHYPVVTWSPQWVKITDTSVVWNTQDSPRAKVFVEACLKSGNVTVYQSNAGHVTYPGPPTDGSGNHFTSCTTQAINGTSVSIDVWNDANSPVVNGEHRWSAYPNGVPTLAH